VAVAVFRTADRCNEAVALDAGTGVRQWTRNLNLRPDMSLVSTDRIVLAISPTGLVSLDPTGDTLRWRYKAPAGCRILGAATGGSGVALLQHCPGAGATALMLLDGFAGTTHWSHDVNAPAGAEIRLLGADQLIGVVVGSEVRFLAGKDGAQLRTEAVQAFAPARQLAVGSSVLLWAGGTLTAFDETTAQPRWHTASLGLPAAPANGGSVLVVPEASGFVRVDGTTGKTVGRSSVAGLASGGVADRIGGTVLYRLPDRVLAYR
jgi:outer membrane protein assembly factor BamB